MVQWSDIWGLFPKMNPTNPWGFPTRNDQHLGCEMGVPPFKETPNVAISGWRIIPGLGGSHHGYSPISRSSPSYKKPWFTPLTNHLLPGMILQVGSFCKMLYHLVSFME